MKHRIQIVMGTRPDPDRLPSTVRSTRLSKFKTLLTGLVLTTLALAILIAALILGSVLAAVLGIIFLVFIGVLAVKSILRRNHSGPLSRVRKP